jgi:hypothetical protein
VIKTGCSILLLQQCGISDELQRKSRFIITYSPTSQYLVEVLQSFPSSDLTGDRGGSSRLRVVKWLLLLHLFLVVVVVVTVLVAVTMVLVVVLAMVLVVVTKVAMLVVVTVVLVVMTVVLVVVTVVLTMVLVVMTMVLAVVLVVVTVVLAMVLVVVAMVLAVVLVVVTMVLVVVTVVGSSLRGGIRSVTFGHFTAIVFHHGIKPSGSAGIESDIISLLQLYGLGGNRSREGSENQDKSGRSVNHDKK